MYCTEEDMIHRFGEDELIQLTDKNNVGGLNTDVLTRAISDANAEIEGYLSSRYSAPVTPVPTTLVRVACDIARYYLYDDMATEHVSKRYNDAVAFLKGVARGDISIGISTEGEKPASKNTVQLESGGNVFNRKDKSFI
jgi:phage gp36-like protein